MVEMISPEDDLRADLRDRSLRRERFAEARDLLKQRVQPEEVEAAIADILDVGIGVDH